MTSMMFSMEASMSEASIKTLITNAAPLDSYPEPKALPSDLKPMPVFDYALLPERLRPWIQDIAERMQCPPDFLAVTAMVGMGTLIGRKVGIRPKAADNWTERANLWGLVIGRPGVMKSPAALAVLAPLKRLEDQRGEAYKARHAEYERLQQEVSMRLAAGQAQARAILAKDRNADIAELLDVDTPVVPIRKRLMANNGTLEAIGELLRQNPNGILVFRDELVSLLKNLDQDDQAAARGFYLQGWSGGRYVFDRIGRGLAMEIHDVCLSVFGTTQPGRIAEYVRSAVSGGGGDDGLLQRFQLIVWPDIPPTWVNIDRAPNIKAEQMAQETFNALDALTAESVGAEMDGPEGMSHLRCDPEALEVFTRWRTELEARLRSNELSPALEAHLSKYRKLVPALALICHLADGKTGPVAIAAMLRALAWAEYLESHATRLYSSGKVVVLDAAREIMRHIRKGDLPEAFTARDIYRNEWGKLSDPKVVHDALTLLHDHDWLVRKERESGGRPAITYTANPRGLA